MTSRRSASHCRKGPLGHDRLRTCGPREAREEGCSSTLWDSSWLRSYVAIWQSDEVLRKKFASTEAVLAEMRTIRCVERTGRIKFITPFVGFKVDISKTYCFNISDNCTPVHVYKAKCLTRRIV